MAQVCVQLYPFLRRVENVGINTTQSRNGQDDVDSGQWLGLVRTFSGARDFWVGDGLMTHILCALGQAVRGHTMTMVLPSLRQLRVENPMALNEPSWDAVQSFVASRSLSGRPVQVNVPINLCGICHTCFRKQQGFERHLVDKHAYRKMCSYCNDFECMPGRNYLFLGHLRSQHPEVEPNDGSIKSSFQLDSLVIQHCSLRAPDIVAPPLRPQRGLPIS